MLKIISGGQTGADRAGLDAAKKFGYNTGGWMPKGWTAQDGSHPEFAQLYNMQEHEEYNYNARTEANVRDSDATIRCFFKEHSAGEKCTLKYIKKHNKPYFDVNFGLPKNWREYRVGSDQVNYVKAHDQDIDEEIDKNFGKIIPAYYCCSWITVNNYKIINIAGNSHRTDPRTYMFTFNFLSSVFNMYSNPPILS
jgi:hypothetical protein